MDRIQELIANIQRDSAELATLYHPPANGPVVSTPDEFDNALATTALGGTIFCSTLLIYPKPLTVTKSVRIVSVADGLFRMTKDEPAPQFTGGIRVLGDDVMLGGLEVRHTDPGVAIIELFGLRPYLKRLRVLGDPINGGKRGIGANGGEMMILRCYIDDIKRKGQDSQGIGGFDFLAPGLLIDDCYISAAGQSIMMGGDDPKTELGIPSDVTVTHCDCTKEPRWLAEGWQVKCAIECKNVKNMIVRDTTAQWAGTSQGQGGFLFVMTPRNQNGHAPWSTVEDVLVERVHARYGCGAINFLGTDSNFPSGLIKRVTFRDVQFDEIDALGPCKMAAARGSGRMFQFDKAPAQVTLENITVNGQNLQASGYFIGAPPTALTLRNMKLATSKYGWKIDGGGQGEAALKAYAPDITYEVTPTDTGASNVPNLP